MGQPKRLPSELEAVGHLLRDVDDREAVAGNSLARAYLYLGHARLRAAVFRAIGSLDVRSARNRRDSHASRQRTIVTRCDLNGEKHAAVASDLGICLRHFYRERRVALARLTIAFRRECEAPLAATAPMPSTFEMDLCRVSTLQLTGEMEKALSVIETTAQSVSAADAVRAWCCGVELAALSDDGDRAKRFLAQAVSAANGIHDRDDLRSAAIDVEMARGFTAWQSRDFLRAVQSVENAVRNARERPDGADRSRMRATIGVFLRGAELACMRGDVGEALGRLGEAQAILNAMPYRPLDLLGQLLVELSIVNGLVMGGIDRAIEYGSEALEVFRSAGMTAGVAEVAGVLCAHFTAGRRYGQALAYGEIALQIADAGGSGPDKADQAFVLSQAEALGGNPVRALLLAEAAEANASGGLFEIRALIARAEALLGLGDHQTAEKLGRRAEGMVSAHRWERMSGIVSRIRAEANSGLGDRDDAVQQVERSIEHLGRHGDLFQLKRAYACSARLTRRRAHIQIARDLEESLTIRLSPDEVRPLLPAAGRRREKLQGAEALRP